MSNTACNTGRLAGAWPVMQNHRDTINCSGGKQGVRTFTHKLNLAPSFSISQLLPSCSSKTAYSSFLLFSLPLVYPLAGSTMFLAGGCAEFSISRQPPFHSQPHPGGPRHGHTETGGLHSLPFSTAIQSMVSFTGTAKFKTFSPLSGFFRASSQFLTHW